MNSRPNLSVGFSWFITPKSLIGLDIIVQPESFPLGNVVPVTRAILDWKLLRNGRDMAMQISIQIRKIQHCYRILFCCLHFFRSQLHL